MANTDTENEDQENQEAGDSEKKGFVKKLLGNKKLLIIVVAALVLLLGGGGAALYFLVMVPAQEAKAAEEAKHAPPVAPQVAYFEIPDLIVNIQSSDGNPVYLKMALSLELNSEEEKAGVQVLMPRIVDQFQAYLRELRPDDLKGSAGIMRLKEELLRRTNVAAAPFHVRDVLLKEMIIQ